MSELSKFQAIRRATDTLEKIESVAVEVNKDSSEMCVIQFPDISVPIGKQWFWQSSEELAKELTAKVKAMLEPYRVEAIASITAQQQKL